MLDLALLDQLLHRSCNVFDGHIRINTMLVKQIDCVGVETLQRSFGDRPDSFRAAIEALRRYSVFEAELGCDNDLVANGLQRFSDYLFVRERTICLGSVEEGYPTVIGGADDLDGIPLVDGRAVTKAKAHAAKAKGRNFQPAPSQCSFLHFFSPPAV